MDEFFDLKTKSKVHYGEH